MAKRKPAKRRYRTHARASQHMSGLGKRLKDCRKKLELTQVQLAEKAELKPSAVSQFETSSRYPSALDILKLAMALGEPVDKLLGVHICTCTGLHVQVEELTYSQRLFAGKMFSLMAGKDCEPQDLLC